MRSTSDISVMFSGSSVSEYNDMSEKNLNLMVSTRKAQNGSNPKVYKGRGFDS